MISPHLLGLDMKREPLILVTKKLSYITTKATIELKKNPPLK